MRLSLLANASVAPVSSAARVGPRPTEPVMPFRTTSASTSRTRRSASAAPSAVAWTPKASAWSCSSAALRPAVNPTTSNRSGLRRMTSSACVPIDPVLPRRTTRRRSMLDSMPLNLGDLCTLYRFSDIDWTAPSNRYVPYRPDRSIGRDHEEPVHRDRCRRCRRRRRPSVAAGSQCCRQRVHVPAGGRSTGHARADAVAVRGRADPGRRGNVQALVDPNDGSVLAAFRSSTRALTPVGPGCTTTSACMTSSTGVPYGLTGSGTKTGTWKNIVRVAAGDRRTSYSASNGAAYNYSAGVTISWSRPVTVVKVSR